MNRAAEENSKNELRQRLAKLDISIDRYQVLEAIFRQEMLHIADGQFNFQDERKLPPLFQSSIDTAEKFSLISEHIHSWEQRFEGFQYGFECYEFNEYIRDAMICEQLNAIQSQMMEFSREFSDYIQGDQIIRWFSEIRNKAFTDANSPQGGYYLQQEESGRMSLGEALHHDFFAKYFCIGSFIFSKFIKRSKVGSFLAYKIRREFPDIQEVQSKVTGPFISDRLRNIKKYIKIHDQLSDSKLLTPQMIRLIKNDD